MEGPARVAAGQQDLFDELPGSAILFAIADEEIFERDLPAFLAPAQHEARGERDECRRAVADGRAVGDIAPHGPAGPDLGRPQAAQQFAEIRILGGDDGHQPAIGYGSADLDGPRPHG